MQSPKKTLVLLAAQPSPCGSEETKTCIRRVLKPLPPRKVLKRGRHRLLQLKVPACQSWWVLLSKEPLASSQLLLGMCPGPQCPTALPRQREGAGCPDPHPTALLCCPGQHQCTLLLGFCLRLFQHMRELEEEAASRTQVGLQQEEDMEVDTELEEEEDMEVDGPLEEMEEMDVD
ncbi:uncharacterized protein ACIB01_019400 [Guaruba guarouba]